MLYHATGRGIPIAERSHPGVGKHLGVKKTSDVRWPGRAWEKESFSESRATSEQHRDRKEGGPAESQAQTARRATVTGKGEGGLDERKEVF